MRKAKISTKRLLGTAMLLSASLLTEKMAIASDPATLTVYSGVPREQAETILGEFAKTYKDPVGFNVVQSPVEELMAQVNLEARSGSTKADVLWFDKPQLFTLSKQHKDLLVEVESPHYENMLDAVKVDNYKQAIPFGLNLYVLSYNTGRYSSDQAPKSYADLLKNEYKDQIILSDPRSSAAIHNFFWLVTDRLNKDDRYGWPYFEQLNQNMNPRYVNGHGAVRDLVISGERPIGIQLTFYLTEAISRGEKVSWHWPEEGVVAGQLAVGVIAKSKHSEVGEALANWMIGPEGQKVLADVASLVPVDTTMDMKFPDGKTVADLEIIPADAEAVGKNRTDVVRRFTQSMRR